MKALLRKVYLYYCLSIFALSFLVVFPFFLIPIIFKKQFHLVGIINRWWARLAFPLFFLPYSIECRGKLDPKKQYLFCPNHFSYLDIATMVFNPHNAIFVGKHEMEKIPLFGFMYRNLHITVNRDKLMSRYSTYKKSQQAIDEGKSLVIFPEGGILSTHFPHMAKFKDGAFKLAIEKQIAIVPVTIASNWIILPSDLTGLNWHPIKLIFHESIHPEEHQNDLPILKEKVFRIIESELMARAENLQPI